MAYDVVTMTEISVRELKSKLSEVLHRAEAGEEIAVTRRGKRIVVIRADAENGSKPKTLEEKLLDLYQAGQIKLDDIKRKMRRVIYADDPPGKAAAVAQILGLEARDGTLDIGDAKVRFVPGGPQGRPELQGELDRVVEPHRADAREAGQGDDLGGQALHGHHRQCHLQ